MKKILVLFAVLMLSITTVQAATDSRLQNAVVVALDANNALVNGNLVTIDQSRTVAPYIDSANRTSVPLRFIAEAFNVNVEWNAATRTATITSNDKIIELSEGSNTITIISGDCAEVDTLDSSAAIHYGRLFVPLRAIADALQKEIFFDRGLIIISDTVLFNAQTDIEKLDEISAMLGVLPTVGTEANFENILNDLFSQSFYYDDFDGFDMPAVEEAMEPMWPTERTMNDDSADMSAPAAAAPAPPSDMPISGMDSPEFSETNVQVQGVDESDIVKTNGELIFYLRVSARELVISKAHPADNMEVLQRLRINYLQPIEMYVDGDDLVIFGEETRTINSRHNTYTIVRVFSIDDLLQNGRNAASRVIAVQGEYQSSRKIGDNVYLTTNMTIPHRSRFDFQRELPEVFIPMYYDTAFNPEPMPLSFNQIRCFPEPQGQNYFVTAAFNISRPDQKVNVTAYIGASDKMYMSHNYMYIARWNPEYRGWEGGGRYTDIHRFGLGEGRLTFTGSGRVDGTVLNQWSMDEHNGYFRIATTKNWLNYVFVLDEDLEIVGEIRDIAPTERIYSARFMGDTLFMVTFQIIDPFFVIDLSNPRSPKVLGELKIPGYSDYLHPFGENLVLGIGKDTIEQNGIAWEQGIRMTMFDVSDFYNPIDLFYTVIGGRGTNSEALRNHKALLISPERNIIAFPATVHGYNQHHSSSGVREFDGGLVFGVDWDNNEFYERGRITHHQGMSPRSPRSTPGQQRSIRRLLYIGDFIYGLSDFGITAHDMDYIMERYRLEY